MPKPIVFSLILLLALLTGCSRPAAAEDEQGEDPFGRTILGIRYAADAPLDASHFDPVIKLRPGSVLTRSGVKDSIQALHDTGRFSSISVHTEPRQEGVDVEFRLRFNFYFNEFRIEGDVDLAGRSIWELVSLPVGERFTRERLEDARETFLNWMREQGYYLARVNVVTARNENERQIDTVFVVQPGDLATVRDVDIRGVPQDIAGQLEDWLGFRQGRKYDRRQLRRRVERIREEFIGSGYLAATIDVSEDFRESDNTVALALSVGSFGRIRVVVDGFKVDRDELRRLLPVLSGEGFQPELLEEGARNLKEHMEERGYPEADVVYREEGGEGGARTLRYAIDAGRKVTVAYVRFRGNESIPDKDLLGVLQIQPARFLQRSIYSVSRLDSDVESLRLLYNSRGFLAAFIIPLVEPVRGAERLGITFECAEGPVSHVASLALNGNDNLATGLLTPKMQLGAGKPYSPQLAERDRQALLAAYNDAGFLQARVSYRALPPNETNSWPVEFEIDEGMRSHVGDIVVLGNDRTRDSVLQDRIKLEPNEPLSLGRMLETQQALYNLGVFDLVRVAPQNPESVAPFQNVVVRVQEARRFTVRYGIGFQEREKLRGTVELGHLNVLGTGQRADLRLRASRLEQSAALTFQQPQIRFLPVNSYFTISAQKEQEVSFDVRRFNAAYQYSHQLNDHSWALLRFGFDNVRASADIVDERDRENASRNLSTLSAIYINDTRDNYLDPQRGFFTSTDLSLTTKLLGTRSYVSLFTQNSYYQPIPGSLLLASSLRFGAAHTFDEIPDLPLSERYFAGGGSSLRGFDTDFAGPVFSTRDGPRPRGGNALLVGNLEVRVPLLSAVHVAGFYDVGNVFRSVSSIRLSDFSHTIGIGVRIKTPFGPLRADYGYNLNLSSELSELGLGRRHFFVTIGPPF
jgi:outer membrane protein insertion porin family